MVCQQEQTNSSGDEHGTCAGFTLVELLVVLMVIGLLAFAADPSPPTGVQAAVLARQVMMDIRLTQAYAMNRGSGYRILTTATNSYEIRQPDGSTLPGSGTTLSDATLSSFTLSFNALGQPSDAASIAVQVAGQEKTVAVTATTGRITVL